MADRRVSGKAEDANACAENAKRKGVASPSMDKTLVCRECGVSFVFTQGEQEFYQSRGLSNPPSRCPKCRAVRRAQMQGGIAPSLTAAVPRPMMEARQMFPATCARCGQQTQVPFQPRGDRPVFCSTCFHTERPAAPVVSRPSVPSWISAPPPFTADPSPEEGEPRRVRRTHKPERVERGDRVRYTRRSHEFAEDEDSWADGV
jgi:CxxC-x17-CxxC domain-containing protein